MLRAERLAMDLETLRSIASRATPDHAAALARWTPDQDPSTVRALAVWAHYELTLLCHLEVADARDGPPDGRAFAARGAALAIDHFWGAWRDDHEYRLWADDPVQHWGPDECRRGLPWFDAWREGLFCASAAADAAALDRLCAWCDDDVPADEGSWDSSRVENDFHVLLGLWARGVKPDARARLKQSILGSRRQRPKLWLAGLTAVEGGTADEVLRALTEVVSYHRKRDFDPRNPFLAVPLEATVLWRLAATRGVALPARPPAALADHIVTPETLTATAPPTVDAPRGDSASKRGAP